MTSVAMVTAQHSLTAESIITDVFHSQGWGPSLDGFSHEQEWLVRLQTTPLTSWHSHTCLSKLLDLPPFVASSQDLSRAREAEVFPCGPLTHYTQDTTPNTVPTANSIPCPGRGASLF